MYIREKHRPLSSDHIVDLISCNRFGILISSTDTGPLATHLPFIFDPYAGEHGTLLAHLARANPHAELLSSSATALVIFSGPHGYVSPSNFPDRASPPSWNYAVVHCHGCPRVLPEDMTLAAIERLVATMEHAHASAWTLADLPEGQATHLARNVIAFEIPIDNIEAKFKMGQGEKPANIAASIRAFERADRWDLADLMRRYNQTPMKDV